MDSLEEPPRDNPPDGTLLRRALKRARGSILWERLWPALASLATAIDALGRYTHDQTLLHGARVEGVRWLPDEESDTPRYLVEATFTASAHE